MASFPNEREELLRTARVNNGKIEIDLRDPSFVIGQVINEMLDNGELIETGRNDDVVSYSLIDKSN